MGPDPAVAAVRLAVRRSLADVAAGGTVLVACSGGADSLALLAAAAFEKRQAGVRAIGVTVDHGLQEGSAEHAAHVVAQMATLGVDETASISVSVDPGPGGIEAGAREARYVALAQLGEHFGAERVLLGHTLDDQAETVLLGLTRGSGGRSLAGMRPGFAWADNPRLYFDRPLLQLTRAQTEAACRAERIEFWTDPQNGDPRFTRSRVRHAVLPMLEDELGPGIAQSLARTADQLRADSTYLDAVAAQQLTELSEQRQLTGTDATLSLPLLAELPGAIRTRVIRLAALSAGSPAAELFHQHVVAVDQLVTDWTGQKWIDLPGPVRAQRIGDQLRFQAVRRG